MSSFWFFVGLVTVAAALRHIKRSPEANPVVLHHAPCNCGCACAGHGEQASCCETAAEEAPAESR